MLNIFLKVYFLTIFFCKLAYSSENENNQNDCSDKLIKVCLSSEPSLIISNILHSLASSYANRFLTKNIRNLVYETSIQKLLHYSLLSKIPHCLVFCKKRFFVTLKNSLAKSFDKKKSLDVCKCYVQNRQSFYEKYVNTKSHQPQHHYEDDTEQPGFVLILVVWGNLDIKQISAFACKMFCEKLLDWGINAHSFLNSTLASTWLAERQRTMFNIVNPVVGDDPVKKFLTNLADQLLIPTIFKHEPWLEGYLESVTKQHHNFRDQIKPILKKSASASVESESSLALTNSQLASISKELSMAQQYMYKPKFDVLCTLGKHLESRAVEKKFLWFPLLQGMNNKKLAWLSGYFEPFQYSLIVKRGQKMRLSWAYNSHDVTGDDSDKIVFPVHDLVMDVVQKMLLQYQSPSLRIMCLWRLQDADHEDLKSNAPTFNIQTMPWTHHLPDSTPLALFIIQLETQQQESEQTVHLSNNLLSYTINMPYFKIFKELYKNLGRLNCSLVAKKVTENQQEIARLRKEGKVLEKKLENIELTVSQISKKGIIRTVANVATKAMMNLVSKFLIIKKEN